MEIDNKDNIQLSYKSSDEYIQNINTLKESLQLILDEYKKLFILSKMYPENEEYQQQFSNIDDNLKQILGKFFSISNEIEFNIDEISEKMIKLNILIKEEREKNRKLKRKLGIIEHKNNASSEMINDYNEIYNIRYLRNWALGLSILAFMATIGIVYK